MIKRITVGLFSTLLAVALVVPRALASDSQSFMPTVGLATGGQPGANAPTPGPLGALPLHPDAYAFAKALANAHAHVGGNKGGGGGGGGGRGGLPTITSYSNVSPSFQGTFQTQLAPPD